SSAKAHGGTTVTSEAAGWSARHRRQLAQRPVPATSRQDLALGLTKFERADPTTAVCLGELSLRDAVTGTSMSPLAKNSIAMTQPGQIQAAYGLHHVRSESPQTRQTRLRQFQLICACRHYRVLVPTAAILQPRFGPSSRSKIGP